MAVLIPEEKLFSRGVNAVGYNPGPVTPPTADVTSLLLLVLGSALKYVRLFFC